MNPKRRQRLFIALFLVLGASAAVALTLVALKQNLNAFYPPGEIVDGSAPRDVRIRAGGMVEKGSVHRATDSLLVSFVISDLKGAEVTVEFTGILPDLFREGQGVLATGKIGTDGKFRAEEVLAKHDEKYMPPELAGMKPPATTPLATRPAAKKTATAQVQQQ